MQPILVDQYVNPDLMFNPDLARFKTLVYDTAKKYQRKNSWCSEVDQILNELGVSKPARVPVRVATSLFTFNVEVDPMELFGKSGDDQAAALCKAFGEVKLPKSTGGITLKLEPWMITEAVIADPETKPEPVGDFTMENGWGMVSRYGQLVHHFASIDCRDSSQRNRSYGYADCGDYGLPTRPVTDRQKRPCPRCLEKRNGSA